MKFKDWLIIQEGGLINDKQAQISKYKPGPRDIRHKPHDDIHICGASGGPGPCQGGAGGGVPAMSGATAPTK